MTPSTSGTLAKAASLALIGALAIGCVSVNPLPTQTSQPSARPTAGPTASPNPSTPPVSPSPSAAPSQGPSQTPDPSDTPAPSGLETPSATVDPALAAQIDEVTAQVPPIRELEALEEVPYEIISREQFQEDLIELNDEDVPVEVRQAEERLLKRLGLLADDADLEAMLLELYGGQVAAYYVPETGHFYIIERDAPFGAVDKTFVSHEYTHALQDQHFDLEGTRITDVTEGDAALAQLAAIEGDATLTMQQWAIQSLSNEELIEILTVSLSGLSDQTLANMPLVLRRQLEFPYTDGFLFIHDVWGLGGFEAVDSTIQTPPASTEQILHSQKYYDQEAPVDVTLDDISATLGDGWSRVYEQTMGELLIQILATGGEEPPISIPGFPVEWPHAEAAAGWGGDRLAMYEHSDGRWAVAWQTAWDTTTDAAEFEGRINELAGTFDGVMSVFEGTVIIASDTTTLEVVDLYV
jgi:hypothetical protein